jgi:hypothetical protein
LDKAITLGVSAHGRYATTSGIKGTASTSGGSSEDLGLAVTDTGWVTWEPQSVIGTGGIRWANVDYTGLDGGILFTYHY